MEQLVRWSRGRSRRPVKQLAALDEREVTCSDDHMRFDLKTKASPEQVLRALTDFTDARLQIWNRTLDPDHNTPVREPARAEPGRGRSGDPDRFRLNRHACRRRAFV